MNREQAFTTIREFVSEFAPSEQAGRDYREVELNGFTFQLLGCTGSSGYVRVECLDVMIANEHPTHAYFNDNAVERALEVIASLRRTKTVSRLVNTAPDDKGEVFEPMTGFQTYAVRERIEASGVATW